jgi:hypothetical protein
MFLSSFILHNFLPPPRLRVNDFPFLIRVWSVAKNLTKFIAGNLDRDLI